MAQLDGRSETMAMAQLRSGRMRALRVLVADQTGPSATAPGLARWLESIAPARARGEVVIALVPDAVMRGMNRRFAGIDRVTDVLSFPAAVKAAGPRQSRQPRPGNPAACEIGVLGDIVIATGRAARQAKEAGHALPTELRVLALHGLLHLLGYDHHADGGTMAQVERRLRRRGGLREGLIERAAS